MKHKLLSVLLILSFFFSSAQNNLAKLEVRYNMKFIPDSTNKNNASYAEVTLLCNENESLYFSRDAKKYYDYLYQKSKEMVGGKINLGTLPAYPKVRGNVYKSGNIITSTLPVSKYNYSFEEPQLKWELLNETKTIDGMKCNLAKTVTDTGDTFFAWYTQQYLFSEGPFRFKGLPGLIIKLYNKNNTVTIDAVEIKKSSEIIEPLSLGSVIKLKSKDEFLKARKTYYENPNINTFGDNIIITDDRGTDYTKRRKEQLSSQNVFLD
ncbi:GLPGLI family protein [Chryseobacterium tongliaoense]|uniref:GLPGLI family protein n=1 Tax=Chryseobacterium tongliaoense TaxID=3240933 RepID=UPI003512A9FD